MINLEELQTIDSILEHNYCFDIEIQCDNERIKRFANMVVQKIGIKEDRIHLTLPIFKFKEEPKLFGEILKVFKETPKIEITQYTEKNERLFTLIYLVGDMKIIRYLDSSNNDVEPQEIVLSFKFELKEIV